jgi:hypothetical protein
MKKDIPIHSAAQVGIALMPNPEDDVWEVYLVNMKNRMIRDIIINSKGYGELDGKKIETQTMRYFIPYLGNENAQKIELIHNDLTQVANEYWITFYIDGNIYDKKVVFVQGSIDETYFTTIPVLEKRGVMIL